MLPPTILLSLSARLIPVHSPLLGKSLLLSFPPLNNMLKFSGYSCLIWGRYYLNLVEFTHARALDWCERLTELSCSNAARSIIRARVQAYLSVFNSSQAMNSKIRSRGLISRSKASRRGELFTGISLYTALLLLCETTTTNTIKKSYLSSNRPSYRQGSSYC